MSLKLLKKLAHKKYRKETGLFMVEGKKSVEELLRSTLVVETIYATIDTMDYFEKEAEEYSRRTGKTPELIHVSPERLQESGVFQTNTMGAAIARQRNAISSSDLLATAKETYVLLLDDVRDPGNLGTIIRTADWFGISYIGISETTSDPYNPKTIAASMGSFTRVEVTQLSLSSLLKEATRAQVPILGAVLSGENLFEAALPQNGIVLMGSESHGISPELLAHVTTHVTIPRYGNAESLNVASATAVILSTLKAR